MVKVEGVRLLWEAVSAALREMDSEMLPIVEAKPVQASGQHPPRFSKYLA